MTQRGTIELSSGEMTSNAGQDLIVYASLPPEFSALRPDTFEIDDAPNWAIMSFHIDVADQLRCSMVVGDKLGSYIREGGCNTIQTRMRYSMTARYQGQGAAKFRCRLSGPCAPRDTAALIGDIASGVR